jgi:hypothetical protein
MSTVYFFCLVVFMTGFFFFFFFFFFSTKPTGPAHSHCHSHTNPLIFFINFPHFFTFFSLFSPSFSLFFHQKTKKKEETYGDDEFGDSEFGGADFGDDEGEMEDGCVALGAVLRVFGAVFRGYFAGFGSGGSRRVD